MQLGFDYELRPNLIWSTAATYEHDKFHGQDRADNVTAIDNGLKYLMNNLFTIALMHRYVRRDSNTSGFSFDKHQVGINATAHF